MRKIEELPKTAWDLGDWEQELTIHVGRAYVCRTCKNLVMVTKGGLGVLQLNCCGSAMEQVSCQDGKGAKR